jgi:hypothetical protein
MVGSREQTMSAEVEKAGAQQAMKKMKLPKATKILCIGSTSI